MQGCGATGEAQAGDGAFAEPDLSWAGGRGDEERSQEVGEVGVVADDQDIFAGLMFAQELLEVFEGGRRGESGGLQDGGLVAGLGTDEGGRLEAAFEWARDDEVELYVHCIQHLRELKAVALAFFIEGALYVEHGVQATGNCTGVTKDK